MAEHELPEFSRYCPVCQRVLTPIGTNEFRDDGETCLLWVHDDVVHADEDISAFDRGVQ